jgi:NADPH:quinone reductase
MKKLPTEMKAILLEGPNDWKLETIPIPQPKKGQVLIKMAYSPINPSDMAFLIGNYGLKKAFPVVPGLEGSGAVVASGGGFLANRLMNQNVACTAPNSGNGTWAEYMLTDASKCIKLKSQINLAQGAMLFVNPLTALAFSKMAKKHQADLIVFSAANGALGRMVLYFAKKIGVPVLGLVRKPEHIHDLTQKGFSHGLCTTSTDFIETLKAHTKSFKKVIFFDAIGGGSLPYTILNALPDQTRMVIYGRLDAQPADFSPQNILFKQNILQGYWLSKEAQKKSLFQILLDVNVVQRMLTDGFETEIAQILSLENLKQGLDLYKASMSSGKIVLGLGAMVND